MKDQYRKRRETLLAKYGGEEGLKQYYSDLGRKSASKRKGKKQGFSYATSEQQREYANRRWNNGKKKDSI